MLVVSAATFYVVLPGLIVAVSAQAFILFEEAIPDSASERVALASITGALQRCRIFPPEPRATLVHKATGYSAKLLRKADQCRAVLACSHLYWQVCRLAQASSGEFLFVKYAFVNMCLSLPVRQSSDALQDAVNDEDVDQATEGLGEESSAGAEAENGAPPLADNEEDGSGPSSLQPPVCSCMFCALCPMQSTPIKMKWAPCCFHI